MAAGLILSARPGVRYATGTMMYFAQGIPQGLLSIAIPAWLASLGVSASDIGSYLAVIVLPWAFKLLTGPLMDRYEYLPMGRRRPWVIGAQLGLSLALLALMLVDNPAEQIGLLMLIGVLINTFAATQDVAVDGMSIDLTPVLEQGRLNAFMSFGKAVGWGLTSAVSGVLLVTVGLAVTAMVASAVAALVLIAFIFVLENEGERTLPWSPGTAASGSGQGKTFRAVFGGLNKVLWTRTSILILAIMFFDGLVAGYGQALMPIAAVKLFGFTTPQWSQLVALMGLTGAVAALAMGPLIDRFGARKMLLTTIALVGGHAFLLAQTQSLWMDTFYVRVMLAVWIMMLPVVMVCVIALAMSICSSTISATQFAIYMSVANLGYSAGAKVYGMLAETSTYAESYLLLSLLVVVMMVVLFLFRETVPARSPAGTRLKPRRQHTVALGGTGSGMFWSGAMRCPKCRSDMEQVVFEGTEIDRCEQCQGIWFDAGELELLRQPEAAATLDTGSAKTGRQHNRVEHYPCPRCNGKMLRRTDEKQTHIWFETCSDCSGSFFDAGEFRDLAEHTISDFFKSLAVPKRI